MKCVWFALETGSQGKPEEEAEGLETVGSGTGSLWERHRGPPRGVNGQKTLESVYRGPREEEQAGSTIPGRQMGHLPLRWQTDSWRQFLE